VHPICFHGVCSALYAYEESGKEMVWMSHGDEAVQLPAGFSPVATSEQVEAHCACCVAAVEAMGSWPGQLFYIKNFWVSGKMHFGDGLCTAVSIPRIGCEDKPLSQVLNPLPRLSTFSSNASSEFFFTCACVH
jgi:hypothetical protein